MWAEDVDDSEFVGGEVITPQQAYIKEYNRGKTMDSAKKSVEKILEIAKKHGYACVVGFWKEGTDRNYPYTMSEVYSGATGLQKEVDSLVSDSIVPMWDHYKDGVKDGE